MAQEMMSDEDWWTHGFMISQGSTSVWPIVYIDMIKFQPHQEHSQVYVCHALKPAKWC